MPLTTEKIIVLGETFYETGDYLNAKIMLKNNAIDSKDDSTLCHYYILLGKVENILMCKEWIYRCAESACPVFWKSPVRKEGITVPDKIMNAAETPS